SRCCGYDKGAMLRLRLGIACCSGSSMPSRSSNSARSSCCCAESPGILFIMVSYLREIWLSLLLYLLEQFGDLLRLTRLRFVSDDHPGKLAYSGRLKELSYRDISPEDDADAGQNLHCQQGMPA